MVLNAALNGNTRETHGSLNSRDAISVEKEEKKERVIRVAKRDYRLL